jgi:hypothetical protein
MTQANMSFPSVVFTVLGLTSPPADAFEQFSVERGQHANRTGVGVHSVQFGGVGHGAQFADEQPVGNMNAVEIVLTFGDLAQFASADFDVEHLHGTFNVTRKVDAFAVKGPK